MDEEKKGGADSEIGPWLQTQGSLPESSSALVGSDEVLSSSDRSKIGRTIADEEKKGGAHSEMESWLQTQGALPESQCELLDSDEFFSGLLWEGLDSFSRDSSERERERKNAARALDIKKLVDESIDSRQQTQGSWPQPSSALLGSDEVLSSSDPPQRDSDKVSLHSYPSQRLEKDSRDPDKVSLHSDQLQRSEKSSRGSDEVSLHSDPPQRSAKDSLPKAPESSSPMTNTPKIDEAQDVFPFQRMNVSEKSQLLELPKNLHSLKIEGCDVLDNIPERVMASIPSLQRLYIINCCSLKSFPEPADLRILHIQNCKKLEFLPPAGKTNQYAFLEHLCIGNSCDSLSVLPLDLFPKLRCLSVWDCQNLNSLSIQEGNQKDLTSLEALEIRDCPELVKFPEGGLPTPNLTSIWLSNCNLKELPLQLRTTLTSLRSIFINKCPELVSLFKGDSASNLSLLSITSCDKLMPIREWGLHMLKCLIKLEIEGGCEDLESFPEEKLLPSKLKSLRVSRLLNLKSLDYKGLQHLTALKTLEISCCAKLESLPEEGLPSSLSVLCIKECSLLKPKLQKQTGDYWPKIARISFIETDKEEISRKSPRSKQ